MARSTRQRKTAEEVAEQKAKKEKAAQAADSSPDQDQSESIADDAKDPGYPQEPTPPSDSSPDQDQTEPEEQKAEAEKKPKRAIQPVDPKNSKYRSRVERITQNGTSTTPHWIHAQSVVAVNTKRPKPYKETSVVGKIFGIAEKYGPITGKDLVLRCKEECDFSNNPSGYAKAGGAQLIPWLEDYVSGMLRPNNEYLVVVSTSPDESQSTEDGSPDDGQSESTELQNAE